MQLKWKWYGLGAVLLFAILQALSGLFALSDLKALDLQFRLLRKHFPASAPEVVVIGIDDISVARMPCLLYTSDAADERSSVDLGGRRIIKKKK